MTGLWIPLTIAAALCQNLRSAVQKSLKAHLSTAGATYVRFVGAWPFSLLYLFALVEVWGYEVPAATPAFLTYCLLGSISQISFTFLLIHLFSFRNFATGIVYSKTETAQVALFGLLLLGDPVSPGTVVAIAVSLVGVVALSLAQTNLGVGNLVRGLTERTTLLGLGCGALLGASVVLFRGATLSLGGDGFVIQAATSLVYTLGMQTAIMGGYLALREPDQLRAILVRWRPALAAGIAAAAGSILWRSAYTIQAAAYVRALGQIELIFAVLTTTLIFRERIKRLELVGIALIAGGILILLAEGL